MRTTLTLDADVVALLEHLRAARRQSLKGLVNEALRLGLKSMAAPRKRRRPFRTQTVSLGRCRAGSLDNIAEALALAEGESFR
ncbi:MAG TPA: ribbon-helix-helix protein, CopG family [Vicinamibacteria bacterium]|nr:ribbon-helix-helix protein, CopG family [Vicinamibacteria bacterium]